MQIKIDFMYLLVAAFAVIGVVQWTRGLIDAIKNKGNWQYSLMSLGISWIVAIAGDGGLYQVCTNALILLALVELCYQLIIKIVIGMLSNVLAKASGQPVDAITAQVEKVMPPPKVE